MWGVSPRASAPGHGRGTGGQRQEREAARRPRGCGSLVEHRGGHAAGARADARCRPGTDVDGLGAHGDQQVGERGDRPVVDGRRHQPTRADGDADRCPRVDVTPAAVSAACTGRRHVSGQSSCARSGVTRGRAGTLHTLPPRATGVGGRPQAWSGRAQLGRSGPDPSAGVLGRVDEQGPGARGDVVGERRRAPADDVHAEDLLGGAQPAVDPHLVPDPQQLAGRADDRGAHLELGAGRDLVEVADVRLDRVERGVVGLAVAGPEADGVHHGVGGVAEDEHVVGLGQVAVVVDPRVLDRLAPDQRLGAHARPSARRTAMTPRSRSATRSSMRAAVGLALAARRRRRRAARGSARPRPAGSTARAARARSGRACAPCRPARRRGGRSASGRGPATAGRARR